MITRKKSNNVFEEARECLGSYDDFPLMPLGTDPMSCLSRNRVPQPFFLASDNDFVLVTLRGSCQVRLPGSDLSQVDMKAGEALYVPAGQRSRIVPLDECIQLKWRAEPGGWEAAIWYCACCGRELHRREFNTAEIIAQQAYWNACREFNSQASLRSCTYCHTLNPENDLFDIKWPEVAAQISRQDNESAGHGED